MADSINGGSPLAHLRAVLTALNERVPIRTIDNNMEATNRGPVAGLMALAKKSPSQPTRSIEDACKQIAAENKFPYASDYEFHLRHPLLKVEYDVCAIIFSKLARDRSFHLVAQMQTENSLRNLRLTCKQMYTFVRVWMKIVLNNKIPKFQSIPKSIRAHPPIFVISPEIGIFEPRTTTIFLDATEMQGPVSDAELVVEKQLALARLVKFNSFTVHQQNVRYITVVVRHVRDARVFMEQLSYFPNLEIFEIAIPSLENARPLERNTAEHQLWHTFWAGVRVCHPGRCCSCCKDWPELKVRFSEADEGVGKLVPGRVLSGDNAKARQAWAHKWYRTRK